MILHRLPGSNRPSDAYADHTLFTQTVEGVYECPEHKTGLGIIAMLSGEAEYRLNRHNLTLAGPAWMLADKGSLLSIHVTQTGTRPALLFFHSSMVESLAKGMSFSFLERVHTGKWMLGPQLEELISLGNSCSSFGMLKADGIVRTMLEELIRQAGEACLLANRLEVAKQSTRIELFKRLSAARDWLLQHYSAAITLEDLAAVATMDRQHFLRMFRQCYQQTPHQYLTEVRLLKARHMLLHSEEKVTAICQQTGFESLTSFSGLFRKRFGLSPVSFRRAG